VSEATGKEKQADERRKLRCDDVNEATHELVNEATDKK